MEEVEWLNRIDVFWYYIHTNKYKLVHVDYFYI